MWVNFQFMCKMFQETLFRSSLDGPCAVLHRKAIYYNYTKLYRPRTVLAVTTQLQHRFPFHAIEPKVIARQVEVVVPFNSIATMRYTYLFKEISISQWSKHVPGLKQGSEVKVLYRAIDKSHFQSEIWKGSHRSNAMMHGKFSFKPALRDFYIHAVVFKTSGNRINTDKNR